MLAARLAKPDAPDRSRLRRQMPAIAARASPIEPASRASASARLSGPVPSVAPSTASAAAATPQAPIPRAEPLRVWAKAMIASGGASLMRASRMLGLAVEQLQHLDLQAALAQRHSLEMRDVDGRLDRRRCDVDVRCIGASDNASMETLPRRHFAPPAGA